MDTVESRKIRNLASKFTALHDAPGIWPWNPNQLDIWAAEVADDRRAVTAAQFVLSVWNRRTEWECGRFEVTDAMNTWDHENVAPFLEWMRQETKRRKDLLTV